jgi:SAM-dependent methyltransferase
MPLACAPVHDAAVAWVAAHATDAPVAVLDIGGRNVGGTWGGSVRGLFPGATDYHVLDIEAGPDVDFVADASTWTPPRAYDVVVAVECFEHTHRWPQICATAFRALIPGGRLVATMAGPGRPPHGALGGPAPAPGEWYANVGPDDLLSVLNDQGWVDVIVDQAGLDVRTVASKPEV